MKFLIVAATASMLTLAPVYAAVRAPTLIFLHATTIYHGGHVPAPGGNGHNGGSEARARH